MNWNLLTDAAIFVALTNFANNILNIIWSIKLNAARNAEVMIKELKDTIREKEDYITELKEERGRYKSQYHSLLAKFKQLEGRIETYQKVYGHELPAIKSS